MRVRSRVRKAEVVLVMDPFSLLWPFRLLSGFAAAVIGLGRTRVCLSDHMSKSDQKRTKIDRVMTVCAQPFSRALLRAQDKLSLTDRDRAQLDHKVVTPHLSKLILTHFFSHFPKHANVNPKQIEWACWRTNPQCQPCLLARTAMGGGASRHRNSPSAC